MLRDDEALMVQLLLSVLRLMTVEAIDPFCRMSTCFELPEVGAEIHLVTHLIVREDQHTLYGFGSETERQLFRDLLKVNRVGAKLALGILSGITVQGFIRCVQEEDAGALSKLPDSPAPPEAPGCSPSSV